MDVELADGLGHLQALRDSLPLGVGDAQVLGTDGLAHAPMITNQPRGTYMITTTPARQSAAPM